MQSLYGSKIEYKMKNNELIGGIFPLKENMNIFSKKVETLGGSKIEMEGSRFDGLGIPLGLYLSNNEICNFNQSHKVKNNDEVLDDYKFNKLINKILKFNKSTTPKKPDSLITKTNRKTLKQKK